MKINPDESVEFEKVSFEEAVAAGSPAEHAKKMEEASKKYDLPQFQKVDATFRSFNGQDEDQERYFNSRSKEEQKYLRDKYLNSKIINNLYEESFENISNDSETLKQVEEKPGFLKDAFDLVYDRAIRMAKEKAEEELKIDSDKQVEIGLTYVKPEGSEVKIESVTNNSEEDINIEGEKKVREASNLDELFDALDFFGEKINIKGSFSIIISSVKEEVFRLRKKYREGVISESDIKNDPSYMMLHKKLPFDMEDKIYELLIKDKISNDIKLERENNFKNQIEKSATFDELFKVIESYEGNIIGGNYSNFDPIKVDNIIFSINRYRFGWTPIYIKNTLKDPNSMSSALVGVTDSFGIRKKAFDLIKMEGVGKFIREDGSIYELNKLGLDTSKDNRNEIKAIEFRDGVIRSLLDSRLQTILINRDALDSDYYHDNAEKYKDYIDQLDKEKKLAQIESILLRGFLHGEVPTYESLLEVAKENVPNLDEAVFYKRFQHMVKIYVDEDPTEDPSFKRSLELEELLKNNENDGSALNKIDEGKETILETIKMEDEVRAIEKLEELFKEGLLIKLGIDEGKDLEKGEDLICEVSGRKVVIANLMGVKVPFYCSQNGTDGKGKGKWYPFFGFTKRSYMGGEYGWFIKGGLEMERGYDTQSIKNTMDRLDATLGDINVTTYKGNVSFYDSLGQKFEIDNFGDTFNQLAGIPTLEEQRSNDDYKYGKILGSIVQAVRDKEEEKRKENLTTK